MLKRHLHVSFPVLVFVCGVVASPFSFAQCGCSDDGHGTPLLGGNSLGQSFPAAGLIAQDTAWQVYEFQRDGVRYLQINDRVGNVRAAIGLIGGTAWVLPMGIDVDRVRVTSGAALPTASARRVFGNGELAVDYAADASGRPVWTVRVLAQAQ